MSTMPEGRVGDLVRIIDASVCTHHHLDCNLHDVYRIVDMDSYGYNIENTRTSDYCGYLYKHRFVLISPPMKATRRLTVKAK